MQLCNKYITFSKFFASSLKATSIFEHFENKDDPHSLHILEITEYERRS